MNKLNLVKIRCINANSDENVGHGLGRFTQRNTPIKLELNRII